MIPLDELRRADQQRLEAAEKEAADALAARDAAQKRLDKANRELFAWRTIVESDPRGIEPRAAIVSEPEFDGNKTRWVRLMVEYHKDEGLSPQRIRKLAGTMAIEVTSQFPYTILHKLKEARKIREDNGLYFPTRLETGGQ